MTVESERITIIEGPPPTFTLLDEENAASGLVEGPSIRDVAIVDMRALNPDELVERCVRIWKNKGIVLFDYPILDTSGNTERGEVPIIAAKAFEDEGGRILRLWVIPHDEDVYEMDDDDGEYEDED